MSTETDTKVIAEVRENFGKGFARRLRAAGKIPAVLYGHGTDPQHLSLPARELAAILRANGTNAIIDLDIEGTSQLALTSSSSPPTGTPCAIRLAITPCSAHSSAM